MNKSPQPVVIAVENQEPVPVIVEALPPPPPVQTVTKGEGHTLAPTTTEQEDQTTSGQRRINMIWEVTQATIALLVTIGMIAMPMLGIANDTLENAFFLIIGFYFSRTNHEARGGIGVKPLTGRYEGR